MRNTLPKKFEARSFKFCGFAVITTGLRRRGAATHLAVGLRQSFAAGGGERLISPNLAPHNDPASRDGSGNNQCDDIFLAF